MPDRYTKTALTVIAVALLMLVAQRMIGSSRAQLTEPMKVQICDDSGHCAELLPKMHPGMRLLTWALSVEKPEP